MLRIIGIFLFAVLMVLAHSVAAKPQRIASLNVCAGQLLLSLVETSRIVSLTFLAQDPTTSYLYKKAKGIPINYGSAEEILAKKPDLVVAGRYTTSGTNGLLKKLGHRVELFELDDSFLTMRQNIRRMAKILGEKSRGEQLIRDMDRRLKTIAKTVTGPKPVAVIFRANGFTMGRRSLVNDVLTLAGFRHLTAELSMEQSGFLSLEGLIFANPALIIFDRYKLDHPSIAHQLLEHPALKFLLDTRLDGEMSESIIIPASMWSCGGPFVVEAVERLSRKRTSMLKNRLAP